MGMAGDGGGEATLPPLERALSLDQAQEGRWEMEDHMALALCPSLFPRARAGTTYHSGPKLSVSAAIVELGCFSKVKGKWRRENQACTVQGPVGPHIRSSVSLCSCYGASDRPPSRWQAVLALKKSHTPHM